MKKILLIAAAAGIAFSSQVAAQTPAPAAAPFVRNVNCPAGAVLQTIIDASSLSRPYDLRVIGPCNENITINRDDLILRGKTPGALHTTINGSITLDGASRVTIRDMKVLNGPGIGIFGTRGTSMRLINVFVKDHPEAGVGVARNSVVRFDDSKITGSSTSENAVFASDGSGLRMFNTEFIATRNDPFKGVALGLYRASFARIDDGNTIRHTKSGTDTTRSLAIFALDTSVFRVQKTGNTVTGNVRLETGSSFDIRDTVVTGNFLITGNSIGQLGFGGGVAGAVTLQRRGIVEVVTSGYAGVTGAVTCTGESAVADHTATLASTGCAVLP